jgi:SAM-dependent methyltransferase
MNLASEYQRQWEWRDWASIFAALPPLARRRILDLGCGVGDQAAELVARGARVVGVDMLEELVQTAASRALQNAEFLSGDLRALPSLGAFDGLWASFAAAYFPDLSVTLTGWMTELAPGGWVALTEVDDLFGHEPLTGPTKALFDAYAREALAAKRYDFHMGRKLRGEMRAAGLVVVEELTVRDQELSFDGPAKREVIEAWGLRLDRMKLLQDMCGTDFGRVRDEFLACLGRHDHRSLAKVHCCIGRNDRLGAPVVSG